MRKLLFIILICFSVYFLIDKRNIHLIENDGKEPIIYRSAQLSGKDLQELKEREKIDLILNLRRKRQDEGWLNKEIEACKKLDLDLRFAGYPEDSLPDKKKLLYILDTLDYAKNQHKTLLIHCRAGADRTGFVSAIAQMYLYGFDYKRAIRSLSFKYGHWPKINYPMERVLKDYQPYQKSLDFRSWVEKYYHPDHYLKHD